MSTEEKIQAIAVQQLEEKRGAEAAKIASERYRVFKIKIDAFYQCPRCWIDHGRLINLTPLRSDTNEDIFKCDACMLLV